MDRENVTQTTAVRRRFLIRTGVLSLVAFMGVAAPLMGTSGPEKFGAGMLLGTLAGTLASWCCALLLCLSASGRFIGAPTSQPILATAFAALIRIVALGAALVSARFVQIGGVRADLLTTGLTFMALFVAFRVSEIFFIQHINALLTASTETTAASESVAPAQPTDVAEVIEPSTSSQESQP